MARTTNKPFAEALPVLMAEREWSLRELSRQTRKRGAAGLAHGSLSQIIRGDLSVTPHVMELIAKAMMIDPSYFAEYRLEQAREALNWRRVGVRKALKALGE